MNKEAVMGLIRHLLTFAGGVFVAQGYLDDQSQAAEGVGALMTLIGLGWSLAVKKKSAKLDVAPLIVWLLLPVMVMATALSQVGCQSLTPEQRSDLTERLIKGVSTLALSIAAHEIGEKNPDLKPVLIGLSQTITFAAAAKPDLPALEEQVQGYLQTKIDDPYYRMLVSQTLSETLAAYGAFREAAPDDPRVALALEKIALALRLAVEPPDTGPPASGASVFALGAAE